MKRPDRSDREAGFALVETLVSAVLLVVIALALLAGVDRAQSTSLQGKARSIAVAIAEQDQERLRSMPASALSNYRPAARTVPAGNVNYSVASRAEWVRDSTGATQSCTNDSTQADYLKITSTVTSSLVGRDIKPVSMTSLVAPPVGVFGPNQGTLAVRVTDSRAQPVAGLPVAITGARSLSDTTNALGCAIFAYIPTGTYHILFNQPGWVDPTNTTAVDFTQTVSQGVVNVALHSYDRAARVAVSFETVVGGSPVTSSGWGATAASTVAGNGSWGFKATAPPQAAVDATNLYPATAGYKFYAGECPGASPETPIPTWFTTAPGSAAVLAPLPGSTTGAVTVRQPPLTLTVTNGATPMAAKIVLTPRDAACAKLTLATNAGQASKTASGALDPGVPFGTYDVCVSGTIAGATKRWTSAAGSPLNLSVANGPNTVPGTTTTTPVGVLDLLAKGAAGAVCS